MCGKSLVAWAGECLSRVPEIDRRICSTDREIIAVEALNASLGVVKRPGALSTGKVGDVAVLIHALQSVEEIWGEQYDVVVMAQPTSVLRTPRDVSSAIRHLIDFDLDAVWTISETEPRHHPMKQLLFGQGFGLDYYDEDGGLVVCRQELKPVYHRNGCAYAVGRDCLLKRESLTGTAWDGIVTPHHTISIDTEFDLEMAEFFMQKMPEFFRRPATDLSGYSRPRLDQPYELV